MATLNRTEAFTEMDGVFAVSKNLEFTVWGALNVFFDTHPLVAKS